VLHHVMRQGGRLSGLWTSLLIHPSCQIFNWTI